MPTELWRGLEGSCPGSAAAGSDSVLDYVLRPSPPASTGDDGAAPLPFSLAEVERLAGMGLVEMEILATLDYWRPLSGEQREALGRAIARGRARGSARLKQAHYDVAINTGTVSAQKHMLDLLEAHEPPRNAIPVRVVRKILE